MYKAVIYTLLGVFIFLVSCTDENNNSEFFSGEDYYPLVTGDYLTYKITKITIDKPSDLYDTSIYYIKEAVDIPIIDNEGDESFRIERFIRLSDENPWEIHTVWSSKRTSNSAEKVEENRRIVKIRFPIKVDLSWDGNLFNDMDKKEYRVSYFNKPYEIGTFAFDSCLTIVQDSSESLIHRDLAYEIYAIHTGLVYKEETYINSQEVIFEVPIEDRITTGTIFIQELVEIGKIED